MPPPDKNSNLYCTKYDVLSCRYPESRVPSADFRSLEDKSQSYYWVYIFGRTRAVTHEIASAVSAVAVVLLAGQPRRYRLLANAGGKTPILHGRPFRTCQLGWMPGERALVQMPD